MFYKFLVEPVEETKQELNELDIDISEQNLTLYINMLLEETDFLLDDKVILLAINEAKNV